MKKENKPRNAQLSALLQALTLGKQLKAKQQEDGSNTEEAKRLSASHLNCLSY